MDGSGAPSNQTKWYGEELELSRSTPTKNGYTFSHWSNGSTTYKPGDKYNGNASLNLTAVWTGGTYPITYYPNADGVSNMPSNQTKTHGVNITLSNTRPTRSGFNFGGWSNSKGTTYQPGATYSANEALNLWAIWNQAYRPQTISKFKVSRCTSSGTVSETGTYIKVSFDWSAPSNTGNVSATVDYKLSSSNGDWTTENVLNVNGKTSGSVDVVRGNNSFNVNNSYAVRVHIWDGLKIVYSETLFISSTFFPIDIKKRWKRCSIWKSCRTR